MSQKEKEENSTAKSENYLNMVRQRKYFASEQKFEDWEPL